MKMSQVIKKPIKITQHCFILGLEGYIWDLRFEQNTVKEVGFGKMQNTLTEMGFTGDLTASMQEAGFTRL